MKPKVYIETSIIGTLAAPISTNTIIAGRQALTREWWDQCRSLFDMVVSELVVLEARQGDPEIVQKRLDYIHHSESLSLTDRAVHLAEAFVASEAIPWRCGQNALHVALCAAHGIDFLLTWDCQQLASAVRRKKIESNLDIMGYPCPIICTPGELMTGEMRFNDPVIEEIKASRQNHASRFKYDIKKIAQDLIKKQNLSEKSFVSYPPKPYKRIGGVGSVKGKLIWRDELD